MDPRAPPALSRAGLASSCPCLCARMRHRLRPHRPSAWQQRVCRQVSAAALTSLRSWWRLPSGSPSQCDIEHRPSRIVFHVCEASSLWLLPNSKRVVLNFSNAKKILNETFRTHDESLFSGFFILPPLNKIQIQTCLAHFGTLRRVMETPNSRRFLIKVILCHDLTSNPACPNPGIRFLQEKYKSWSLISSQIQLHSTL